MTYQYHDESIIKSLPEDTVFVFGSNLAGEHNDGAARIAQLFFGAMTGIGRGWSGQSFAIPTLNEHLQQMPISQIAHYIEDFKIYAQNHLTTQYFITALGCGIAGYQVSEIAPLFQGISSNVIFPESFRPYVEKNASRLFPNLTSKLLHSIFSEDVILADDYTEALKHTTLSREQKQIALKVLEEKMYPEDQYGRNRNYEIEDILKQINSKIFHLPPQSDESYIYGGVILALMELYDFNEQDFIHVWNGEIEIKHPIKRHH
ncbi:hypothetical protein [Acinetobacter sp. ANC 3791]|uniref:A1S_2505 family phage non-structural protein n=1 Tax=Acinetobacter sp. ANC 3791 TaxID=2529836 RepID=UPI001038EC2E|nr:hypothetical protein [Acinetobacter sp. ANC 3791]TCB83436.1 hypothetical protein E0H90_11955 [Acinetobacter sp. ANC 3791]